VAEAGKYAFTSRVATTKDRRSFQLKLNGQNLGGVVSVPNTGGWQKWADSRLVVDLPAGEHELEIYFQNQEQNLNFIDVAKADDIPPSSDGWKMVWQDEFNGTSIDPSKWQLSDNAWGGGNNELQYYTARSKNASIKNGVLEITAHRDNYTGLEGTRDYTSARLDTKTKADFLYGKIAVRAKLPKGQGLWPAIWMLPTDDAYSGWASSGEIDIMEAVNLGVNGNSAVHGTLHYGGKWPNNTHSGDSVVPDSNPATHFHEYSIEWEPGEIRWYVDGVLYQTQADWWTEGGPYPAPFDQRFHLILNVAVGGNWPGKPDSSSTFPQTMAVDYVRVYEKTAVHPEPTATLNVVNHGGGMLVSTEGGINCGVLCRREFSESTVVVLTAQPTDGYRFSRWGDSSECQYSGSQVSDTCYIEMNPDQGDKTMHAYFVADDSCSQTSPYQGNAAVIPGRIGAEDYDEGCAEQAYSDADVENVGNKYRNDEVDIEAAQDSGGGYNLGWLRDGEWLDYTISVVTAGAYDINLRVASKGNGSIVSANKTASLI